MPLVKPRSKVLVTGASGFIGAWVVKGLLDQGFSVRGTVRSAVKGNYLANLLKEHRHRFEYIVVEDMAKENAFDEAVKGVDAVEHIASPVTLKVNHPDELIVPAVKGTTGVLGSILEHGHVVQRVVITSSAEAVSQPVGQTIDEKIWNDYSIQEVKEKGREATPFQQYRASKTLAERAAWTFVEKHQGDIMWDLTTLLPVWVMGRTIHEVSSPDSLNASISFIYRLMKGRHPISAAPAGSFVDVRDVVEGHVKALTTEEASGQRFILASGPYTWQDFFDVVHSEAGTNRALSTLPKGTPGAGKDVTHPTIYDATKAHNVLGMTFRKLGECAQETVKSLLEREKTLGW